MNTNSLICVLGADTLIGSALVSSLARAGLNNLVSDLADRPEYVFVAAGRSGGILANQRFPADLCLDNLLVAINVLPEAHRIGVKRLLYLGSSCVYPKYAPQPLSAGMLMTGLLEQTSDAYAMAKLAGMKLCNAYRRQYAAPFITAIPADAYGPGVEFDAEEAHVIPSLLVKMQKAKQLELPAISLWGTGTPRREFTHADDIADACITVMRNYDSDLPINIGSGEMHSIRELAEMIRKIVGFAGELHWDHTHADGAPVKWLDTKPLCDLGWRATHSLESGLRQTYSSLLETESFVGSTSR